MVDLISRTNSDTELDTHRLQNVLDTITSELTIPFLERRARAKSHKKNPLEELNYVIQELTNRERELQAAVGIAKMLIERNEAMAKKIKDLRTKKHYYKESLRELKDDNTSLKKQLALGDEKYQQVNDALISAEEQQIKLLAEHKRILRESSAKSDQSPTETVKISDPEVTELISRHKEQADYFHKTKEELEKKLGHFENLSKKQELQISLLNDDLTKLKSSLEKSKLKSKDLEETLSQLEESKGNLEQKYKELTFKYNQAKTKADRLHEDMQDIEQARAPEKKKIKVRRHISLMSELEEIDKELTQEQSYGHAFTLCSPVHSKLSMSKSNSVASVIGKKPREIMKRKNPLEEYFTLVIYIQITQAVKLNSPYMDAICIIPPNELYERALKQDIPFHRWHVWVESQLTAAYIEIVYKTHLKTKSYF
ncbi:hypothetical protein SteCoe_7454 [Stentor coeruleus]|uniref:Uncharacterized protein n=1 Tax=Stentor coeruleus TaxID=5963 RepID=A0A1R2CMS4_9CILI|nr:hypothetical protein SteCoe_7454 [Stentor coeruleus]